LEHQEQEQAAPVRAKPGAQKVDQHSELGP
jgi:hypothetical protein